MKRFSKEIEGVDVLFIQLENSFGFFFDMKVEYGDSFIAKDLKGINYRGYKERVAKHFEFLEGKARVIISAIKKQ